VELYGVSINYIFVAKHEAYLISVFGPATKPTALFFIYLTYRGHGNVATWESWRSNCYEKYIWQYILAAFVQLHSNVFYINIISFFT
jgi:hypothetical protein